MEKNIIKIISFAIFLLIVTMGCKKNVIGVSGVSLNKPNITLGVGESATLTATVSPDDADNKTVNWTSSNPIVATVSNGKVTAKEVGETTITVTTKEGNYSAECSVTVTEYSLEPTIIDLTNAINGENDISTLKIFCRERYLLVSTSVEETGYKITLPNPETVNVPLRIVPFPNMSDPNAMMTDIGIGPLPYNNNEKLMGQISLESDNGWYATYFYFDRDCNNIGEIDYPNVQINITCYFKHGWNIIYTHNAYKENVLISLWTTEKPSGEIFKWRLLLLS